VNEPNAVSWKRRLGGGLLVAGAVAIALQLYPQWPVEQRLVFRFEHPSEVRALTTTWTPRSEDAPHGGMHLDFPRGAPSEVEHHLSLPGGDYIVEVRTRRAGSATATARQHHVRFDGHQVILFVNRSSQ
jgi:hypothetical protein